MSTYRNLAAPVALEKLLWGSPLEDVREALLGLVEDLESAGDKLEADLNREAGARYLRKLGYRNAAELISDAIEIRKKEKEKNHE